MEDKTPQEPLVDQSAVQKAKKRSLLTPEREEAIMTLLEQGINRAAVAAQVGIGNSTLYEWLADKPDFRARAEEAEAKAISRAIKAVESHFEKDWRAAAWYLKVRGGEQWQEISRVDHTSNGKAVTFTIDFGKTLQEPDATGEEEE